MSNIRTVGDFPRNEPGLVDKFLGTSYDKVRNVSDNMDEIGRLDDVLAEIPTLAEQVTQETIDAKMPEIQAEVDQRIDASMGEIDGKVAEAADSATAAAGSVTAANNAASQANTAKNGAEAAELAADQAAALATQEADRSVTVAYESTPFMAPYNAKGDGVTNDTAAFTAWEAAPANRGKTVDLRGRTVLIDNVPRLCAYTNGKFLLTAISKTRVATTPFTFINQNGRYNAFGGQLNALRKALTNPFFQHVGIVLIGDSITWGSGTGENLPFDPRNGTLKDPRDSADTDSYVNIFKRYIGRNYMNDAAPVHSNFEFSTQGQSITTYQREIILTPDAPDFATTTYGSSISTSRTYVNTLSESKWQYQYSHSNTSSTAYHEIAWTMTGSELTLSFASLAGQCLGYELFVNDVSQGVFVTTPGSPSDSGVVIDNSNNNRRTHVFGFKRNAKIRIRTVRDVTQNTAQVFRLNAVVIKKKVRISNQGINGATTQTYTVYNLNPATAPGFSGKPAVDSDDSFVTIQLGSNDRGITAAPGTPVAFEARVRAIIGYLPVGVKAILMCANPAVNTPGASMTMQDIRASLLKVSAELGNDFVDNYAAWGQADPLSLSADALHPNVQGFNIMACNLIRAMEDATDPFYVLPPVPIPWKHNLPVIDSNVTITRVGTSLSEVTVDATASVTGKQFRLQNGNTTPGGSYQRMTFRVTGSTRLRIYWSATTVSGAFELFVNNVSTGDVETKNDAPAYNFYKDVVMPANSATVPVDIELRTMRRPTEPTGTIVVYLESITVDEGATIAPVAPV
ncbi:GDSL-like Lipase/Acylhydrolase [compost metagenome]